MKRTLYDCNSAFIARREAAAAGLDVSYDVVIIGAGLAGLQCARELSGSSLRVLLADRKASLSDAVHTTGIFVRRTLEDFDLPSDLVGPVVRDVTLYSPARRPLNLSSPHDEFRVGRMGPLYERLLAECVRAGVDWSPETQYLGTRPGKHGSDVTLRRHNRTWTIRASLVVGADGARSQVAPHLGLDQNRSWIVGVEDVLAGVPLEGPPRFHCFLEPKHAPGYIAWVIQDGEETHIGVGGYNKRFHAAESLEAFTESIARMFDLSQARKVERRGGWIPVGGVLDRISNRHGLLVGDAAGAVSPLTAGGLDGAMRLSRQAAVGIRARLTGNDPHALEALSGAALRRRFLSRSLMRRTLSSLRSPLLLEAGCAMARLPLLRAIAWQIFFGRGSFPDVPDRAVSLARPLRAL